MTDANVTLSESAARRIKALSQDEGRPLMLRVAVAGGGMVHQIELVLEA